MTARESAAYHEAGHAVVGVLSSARLLCVQVKQDGAGRCKFLASTLTGDAGIRTAMAGPAAEYLFSQPEARGFTLADCNASLPDIQDIDNYCANFPPAEGHGLREQHWAATCQMLVSHWAAVQAVASEIIEHEYVRAYRVMALLK